LSQTRSPAPALNTTLTKVGCKCDAKATGKKTKQKKQQKEGLWSLWEFVRRDTFGHDGHKSGGAIKNRKQTANCPGEIRPLDNMNCLWRIKPKQSTTNNAAPMPSFHLFALYPTHF